MPSQDVDRELSVMLKELSDGITEELKTAIPKIDLKPVISDAKIQQAILDITPDGWLKLYSEFGQQEMLSFVSDFGKGRRW